MFKAIPTFSALENHLAKESNQLVALSFADCAGERTFTDEDALFAHTLVNLPDRGRFPVAFVTGELSGADLALALSCPLVGLAYDAALSTGFGRPGSAAIYVVAARRIGPFSCEKLLFGSSSATAEDADAALLAKAVASQEDALALANQRIATMISVARANLITWPMPLSSLQALTDER